MFHPQRAYRALWRACLAAFPNDTVMLRAAREQLRQALAQGKPPRTATECREAQTQVDEAITFLREHVKQVPIDVERSSSGAHRAK